MSLVLLRHDEEPPELEEQFAAVEHWTEEVVAGIHTVSAAGDGALAQILDLGFFGDLVALELADRAGIDPGPTPPWRRRRRRAERWPACPTTCARSRPGCPTADDGVTTTVGGRST